MLQFCKIGPEAQENFAIFSIKYGHTAIQNGGSGAYGGALAPLDPPLRQYDYLEKLVNVASAEHFYEF